MSSQTELLEQMRVVAFAELRRNEAELAALGDTLTPEQRSEYEAQIREAWAAYAEGIRNMQATARLEASPLLSKAQAWGEEP